MIYMYAADSLNVSARPLDSLLRAVIKLTRHHQLNVSITDPAILPKSFLKREIYPIQTRVVCISECNSDLGDMPTQRLSQEGNQCSALTSRMDPVSSPSCSDVLCPTGVSFEPEENSGIAREEENGMEWNGEERRGEDWNEKKMQAAGARSLHPVKGTSSLLRRSHVAAAAFGEECVVVAIGSGRHVLVAVDSSTIQSLGPGWVLFAHSRKQRHACK